MKKILSIPLLILCFTMHAQHNQLPNDANYTRSWANVAKFEKESLPKSASEAVDDILKKAIAEKNSPQIIKALIHQGKYDLALDAENDSVIFRNLHEMLQKSPDDVEKSVLNSMLGELYLQYYQQDSWQIDQRTELGDFVPADMKEWTRNIFRDKIVAHLNASLQPQGELEKTQVQTYAAVVELGKDSRRFFPSMFDFLALRAIGLFPQISDNDALSKTLAKKQISQESLFAPVNQFIGLSFNPGAKDNRLWTLETYRKLLASLQTRKMDEPVLLVNLQKMDYLQQLSPAYENFGLSSLQTMLNQWSGSPLSVEIVDKMADFYLRPIADTDENRYDNPAQMEKMKQLYELLRNAIEKYPDYERINILKNRLSQITQPSLSVSGQNTFAPHGIKSMKFSYKNLSDLTLKIYRTDVKSLFIRDTGNAAKIQKQLVKTQKIKLRENPPYVFAEDSATIDVDKYGAYLVEIVADKTVENNNDAGYKFFVSDISSFSRAVDNGKYEIVAVDRLSGKPIAGAGVSLYKRSGDWRNPKLETVQETRTDKNGLAQIEGIDQDQSYNFYYQVTNGNDSGSQLSSLPHSNFYTPVQPNAKEQISIFTDRGIYRPGQTVYFKAVSAVLENGGATPVSGRSYPLELLDNNRQKIFEKRLTTNEFGSLAGEFALPQDVLPGYFTLKVGDARYNFRVEEYKRPTFEITFDKIDQTYKFGEKITVKGKAENFSGIKLQNTSVSYTINRNQILWWGRWGGYPDQFAQGETQTDEDGAFQITFTPEKNDASPKVPARFNPAVFMFTIDATITDVNGETQTNSYTVSVGDVSMLLNVETGEKIEKSQPEPILISAKNLDGTDIPASGTYTLSSLQENDSVRARISQGNFATGEQKALRTELEKLPSGKYRIELQSKDDRGNAVTAQKDFVLYAYDDKKPPVNTNDWYIEKNLYFSENKSAEIILGVSDKDVHVLYEIWQEKTLLERKWMTLSGENKLFRIAYKPEYKNAVSLFLTYVKNEKFYSRHSLLGIKTEKKGLTAKLDVFRDKLSPGAKEEWRLSVKDAQGKPALAEVLASMYDLSLDKIYESPHWNLNVPVARQFLSMSTYQSGNSFGNQQMQVELPTQQYPAKEFSLDSFKWFGFSFSNNVKNAFWVRGTTSFASSREENGAGFDLAEIRERKVGAISAVPQEAFDAGDLKTQEKQKELSAPQIRRNFNETAFFYPQLRTDENGGVQIAFTVPESNTQWKFRVLAHDKNLNPAQTEAIAVSRKELMVTPNMPRFFRQGDVTTISAKISNLSESTIGGTARLILFDPLTNETIPSGTAQQQPFSLKAGASENASWTFDVPKGIDLLGVRVIAESESFSDGEQHALAVLPNRMMVTESLPMDANGKQTKQFELKRLSENQKSSSAQNYRLTLEFASNPAWYAVQALPVLANPDNENAVSWFASYYANTLGAFIGKTYPKVSAMIEAWKKQGGNEETLLSNLEKNQELKNVLLEETPWVLEAKNEGEQKQKLSLLFDLNRNQNLTSTAMAKLKELQTESGGWSWLKGFYPSRSITQYILYGFSQLKELKTPETGSKALGMQKKAITYIDGETLRNFEQLKKHNKNWKSLKSIPTGDLEYLYVRGAYPEYPLDKETAEMVDFYTSVATKNWTQQDFYARSLIAVLAQRAGQAAIMQSILKSYREHATVSDEMGMFWPNNRAHVFMSQSAVSVYTFIMDAFLKGGADAKEMDAMKRWLLKQKQTQLWESTHASIDAVYALLSTGGDWLGTEGKARITIGSQLITPEKTEAGTGYFKESWGKSEINADMARVKVQNEADVPVWGALHLQYFEDLDKITKTDASLDVEKMYFVEQAGESGKNLRQISGDNPLKVGDKVVVRLTLRTDRDLEFVHLKDMRAACLEPAEQLSGMEWQGGTLYYRTSKDASTNFYFDVLPRGTYVFEYATFVTRAGSYSTGTATVQCLYAPQFSSHTAGIRINVK